MNDETLSKNTVSFGLALVIASLVNAVLVVAKESSKAVMEGMKAVTGHHWTTHVAIVILLFIALGLWLRRGNGPAMTASRFIRILAGGIILSGLIIVGFYLIGD